MANELVPMNDLERMAQAVAKSGLFGVKTADQALALMLVAQAEQMHPMAAVQEFDIIQGKPARKSWSMQARFQRAGGSIDWHKRTDTKASATFSHPQGGSVRVDWDMARAQKAGLSGKDNWHKYPRAMLSARVISEGVRAVFPGATGGFYTPEEERDMVDVTPPKPAKVKTPPHDPITGEILDPVKMANKNMDDAILRTAGFPDHSLPPTQPELPAEQPPQTDESARAEAWANEAIARISEADDLVKIDKFMEKNRARLAQVRAANPDAGMAVVDAAEVRKRQIELQVPA